MGNTILLNKARIGNFTSSEAVRLTGIGKRPMTEDELKLRPKTGTGSKTTTIEDVNILDDVALEYISEKNMERKLCRSLDNDSNARSVTWGKWMEQHCFNLLGIEYSLCSQETIVHPTIPFFSGSPDGVKEDTVIDIKNPITLKSFCQLVDPLYDGLDGMDCINALRFGYIDGSGLQHKPHKDAEKYFYQLVGNAILTNSKYAELIIHVPFLSQIEEIRESVSMYDGEDQYKYRFIAEAPVTELPYLVDDGFYKNLNIIRFEVPEADKEFLTNKILKAGELLTKKQ